MASLIFLGGLYLDQEPANKYDAWDVNITRNINCSYYKSPKAFIAKGNKIEGIEAYY